MTAMSRLLQILVLSALALAIPLTATQVASAKASRVASYPMDKAWPTAVRFLRIDLGYTIVERDAEAGYVIFEYKKADNTYRGSLELVTTTDYADRDSVKILVEITDRPEYEEAWVIEKMIERLREDLGQPVYKSGKQKKKDKGKGKKDADKQKKDGAQAETK